jgi:ABC-type nitrate/sulfonate/bicarbonate transport system substrate-binding protein
MGIQRNSMIHVISAVIAAAILSISVGVVLAQTTTTLRYGQIPSTVKSVSALHFNIAQRKGLFVREGINVDMIAIEGGAANMMAAHWRVLTSPPMRTFGVTPPRKFA